MSSRHSVTESQATDRFYPCQSMESYATSHRAGRGFRDTPVSEDVLRGGDDAVAGAHDRHRLTKEGKEALDKWEAWKRQQQQLKRGDGSVAPASTTGSHSSTHRRLPPRSGGAGSANPSFRSSLSSAARPTSSQPREDRASSARRSLPSQRQSDHGDEDLQPPSALAAGVEATAALPSVPSSRRSVPLPVQETYRATSDDRASHSNAFSSSSSSFAVEEPRGAPASHHGRSRHDSRRGSEKAEGTSVTNSVASQHRLGSRADSALHHLLAGDNKYDYDANVAAVVEEEQDIVPRPSKRVSGKASSVASSSVRQQAPQPQPRQVQPPPTASSRAPTTGRSASSSFRSTSRDGRPAAAGGGAVQRAGRRTTSASPSARSSRTSSVASQRRGGAGGSVTSDAPTPARRAGTTPPRRRPGPVGVSGSMLSGSQASAASRPSSSKGGARGRPQGVSSQPRSASGSRASSASGRRPPSSTARSDFSNTNKNINNNGSTRPTPQGNALSSRSSVSKRSSAAPSVSGNGSTHSSARRQRHMDQERPEWQDVAAAPQRRSGGGGGGGVLTPASSHSRVSSFQEQPHYADGHSSTALTPHSRHRSVSGSRRRLHDDRVFDLETERRASVSRRRSTHHGNGDESHADPLSMIPPEELERLLAPRGSSVSIPRGTASGGGGGGGMGLVTAAVAPPGSVISRLDMTREEDLKELFKQNYVVDPLLQRRPGRRQFHHQDHIGLTGTYGMWGELRPSSEAGDVDADRQEESEEPAVAAAAVTTDPSHQQRARDDKKPAPRGKVPVNDARRHAPPSKASSKPGSKPASVARPPSSRGGSIVSSARSSNLQPRPSVDARARKIDSERDVAERSPVRTRRSDRSGAGSFPSEEDRFDLDMTSFEVRHLPHHQPPPPQQQQQQQQQREEILTAASASSAGDVTPRSLSKVGGRFTEEMAELEASRDHDIFGVSQRIQEMMGKGKAHSTSRRPSMASSSSEPFHAASISEVEARREVPHPQREDVPPRSRSANEPFEEDYRSGSEEARGGEDECESGGDGHYSDDVDEGDDNDAEQQPHKHAQPHSQQPPRRRGFHDAPVVPLEELLQSRPPPAAPGARSPRSAACKPKDHDIFGRNWTSTRQLQEREREHAAWLRERAEEKERERELQAQRWASRSPLRGNAKNRESESPSYILHERRRRDDASSTTSSRMGTNTTPNSCYKNAAGGSRRGNGSHQGGGSHAMKSPSPLRQQQQQRTAGVRSRSGSAVSPRRGSGNATSAGMRNAFVWKQ